MPFTRRLLSLRLARTAATARKRVSAQGTAQCLLLSENSRTVLSRFWRETSLTLLRRASAVDDMADERNNAADDDDETRENRFSHLLQPIKCVFRWLSSPCSDWEWRCFSSHALNSTMFDLSLLPSVFAKSRGCIHMHRLLLTFLLGSSHRIGTLTLLRCASVYHL